MPKPKAHRVRLIDVERQRLRDFTTSGIASARGIRHALILLLGDESRLDVEIADAVDCCVATVERIRRRCAAERVEAALVDRPGRRWSRGRSDPANDSRRPLRFR